ncbi:MAG TPA: glycosyltransferase [Bryobacteraceae bacterium]|nr:glycosyltransferase [Bryobacteraceae bacterium]
MSPALPEARQPLVSVILPTRDRPRLLALALEYYRLQTYARRELIVVDDGELFPADPAPIEALGGRLIRVPTGTPTGSKLNIGVEQAHGAMCQKMDDDDWYAPAFLERMVAAARDWQTEVCRPTLSFLLPFLFFEVARWEIRQSHRGSAPGATLLFSRDAWENRPFRPVSIDEDVWFLLDLRRWGAEVVPVRAWDCYLALRHRGSTSERGHIWTHQNLGRALEDYLQERPLHNRTPEQMLPEFALKVYRELRQEILSGGK